MMGNFFDHNLLKRLPHPPYSPDISPSEFSFFEKVKGASPFFTITSSSSRCPSQSEVFHLFIRSFVFEVRMALE
jgi:hypothetical protein